MNRINQFTTADKNNLLSKTFYVLPDNPSDKNFSPSQIKKKGYEGYVVLFDFLNDLIGSINANIDLSNTDISAINSSVSTLQSYFTDGIAKKATGDKNGNDIAETYETKENVNKIVNGTTIVEKAHKDDQGYKISDYTPHYVNVTYSYGTFNGETRGYLNVTLKKYNGGTIAYHSGILDNASTTRPGLMSAGDKTKLDGLHTYVEDALPVVLADKAETITISGGQATDYVYTVTLKNADGNTLSTATFDLPIESVVVGGSYDSTNKKVVLTLDGGSTIEFSVADLISGLVSQTAFDALSSTVTSLTTGSNKSVRQEDISLSGGFVAEITKGGVSYPIAQSVSVKTEPKTVQSTTDLPSTNDGFLYVVLDDGYLYHWSNGAWTQGYQFTSDLFTITEVDNIEED